MMRGAVHDAASAPHSPLPAPYTRSFCRTIARLAVRCLYAELALYPKPGLVSLIDNGSHRDMTAQTFLRSLFALRHYFVQICRAGFDDAPFAQLKALGIEAERRMLQATGGINTHRGAIFSLGLLCAAAGRARAERIAFSPVALRGILLQRWGVELAGHTQALKPDTHGLHVAAHYRTGGAREEGALGLPSLFEVGWPAMQRALQAGRSVRQARIDTLFALMAHISDTNVFHRGGQGGALVVQREARRFLAQGGSANPDWQAGALACHQLFVRHRLSPGGAADLLAATCLLHAIVSLGEV